MKRVIIVILDSVGIGELPDADVYGDIGSNTLGNISRLYKDFRVPNLEKMGIANIAALSNVTPMEKPLACYGKMSEKSLGKDTTTGHWEISGLLLDKAFPTYEHGFPVEIIEEFEKAIGRKVIGNIVASGTEIIKVYGEEHLRTGYPIVYTSADSVFQIVTHEGIIDIEELYSMCEKARVILKDEHAVGRVIARPFEGEVGNFKRTKRRKDFSLKPFNKTILNYLKEQGFEVKAVGKIEDIFNGEGITEAVHTSDNMDGINKTIDYIKENFEGLIFTNLVEFDMNFGHRNDVEGYAKALMDFDNRLPEIIEVLKEEDILIITADHGCDPSTPSTDHSREYVPIIIYGNNIRKGKNIGVRETFSDIAATIKDYFGIEGQLKGKSFLDDVLLK